MKDARDFVDYLHDSRSDLDFIVRFVPPHAHG